MLCSCIYWISEQSLEPRPFSIQLRLFLYLFVLFRAPYQTSSTNCLIVGDFIQTFLSPFRVLPPRFSLICFQISASRTSLSQPHHISRFVVGNKFQVIVVRYTSNTNQM
jgi:hypothetical protein